jgi:hypothetical protein
MSATAAVWKRELNSKHIWPFSLSVRNDWDGYNCVCNPICIEYHATSSFLSHSHTHTHTGFHFSSWIWSITISDL